MQTKVYHAFIVLLFFRISHLIAIDYIIFLKYSNLIINLYFRIKYLKLLSFVFENMKFHHQYHIIIDFSSKILK